jgi:NitT/TauT family transport system ATP-binding protein
MSAALTLERIGHAYLGRTVLDRIDLTIAHGEVMALVGPSGCGKSTLAHIAAGIIEPLRGRVTRGYSRHGMVFQEPRLMPWASAADNIGYPLKLAGASCSERKARVLAAADRVALAREDLDKFPVELSGGMRQRAAIARAMVMEPDFIFFDEPFTALDQALKRRMQDLVIAAAADRSFGALFITHDLMEAVRIAHRVAVMDVNGLGLAGERRLDGEPGARPDPAVFERVQAFLADDPLFRHIHDVDERRVA